MYIHQLREPNRHVVIHHAKTGVIKWLHNSGAVFDQPPIHDSDTSTISKASSLLLDDCWELASPTVAQEFLSKWRNLRNAQLALDAVADSLDAISKQPPKITTLDPASRPNLRLVHVNDKAPGRMVTPKA